MKAFAFLLLFALAVPAVSAEEPVVALKDLLAEVLQKNPDVLAAQKKYEAAKARPSAESSLPDPTISFGYTNMGNPLPFQSIGKDPLANAGVSIAQELPFPGKLKLRGQMAQQDASAAFQDYQTVQLEVVSRLKQAYYELYYVYQALDSLAKNKDLLEKFTKIAENRYSVGQGQQQDILKAQVELSILLTRRRKLEQQKQTLEAEINSLLNRHVAMPLGRPADYPHAQLRYTLDELIQRAEEKSPEIRKEQAMVEKNQLGLQLSRRTYYPDFGVMGGYFNSGSFPSMWQFRLDVKVPVWFWRKQRAEVAEQANNLSAARHQYDATLQMHHFGMRDAYLAAQTSDELVKLYSGAILPQATLALESSLSSYQVGAVDFLTLLTNFRTVLDYELNYYEEVAAFQKALARLEQLTGLALT